MSCLEKSLVRSSACNNSESGMVIEGLLLYFMQYFKFFFSVIKFHVRMYFSNSSADNSSADEFRCPLQR